MSRRRRDIVARHISRHTHAARKRSHAGGSACCCDYLTITGTVVAMPSMPPTLARGMRAHTLSPAPLTVCTKPGAGPGGVAPAAPAAAGVMPQGIAWLRPPRALRLHRMWRRWSWCVAMFRGVPCHGVAVSGKACNTAVCRGESWFAVWRRAAPCLVVSNRATPW